jgi:hypothetical protein
MIMQPLNTIPIEIFLEKSRIAKKSGQRSVTLSIDDATMLADSLSVVMTRLAGDLDEMLNNLQQQSDVSIKMDGGNL